MARSRMVGRFGIVLLPVLVAIGVAFLGCVVAPSLASLMRTEHPYLGWSDWVVADAMELASGHLYYADPAQAYVGLLYTPLYDVAFALLLRVSWWEGWGVALSLMALLVSSCALAVVTGRIGLGESRFLRASDVLTRVGFWLVILWYFMDSIPVNGIFEARPEQFAWMWTVLAIATLSGGLVERRSFSRLRLVLVFVLLVAAVLSKQTTAPFAVLIAVAAVWGQLRSPKAVREALRDVVISVLPAAAIAFTTVVLMQWLSGGFFLDLVIGVPSRHARVTSLDSAFGAIAALTRSAAVLTLLSLVVAAIAIARRTVRWRARWAAVWFAAAVAVQYYASSTAFTKQGADTNQAVGMVIVLSVTCAFAVRVSGMAMGRLTMCALLLLALLVPIGLSLPLYSQAKQARAGDVLAFTSIPRELTQANASGDRVFDPYFYPSTGVLRHSSGDPGFFFTETVPAGYSPRSMVEGLLSGDYALATKLDAPYLDQYASAFGRRDESVAWKVNWILDEAFEPSGVEVNGVRYRQPRRNLAKFAWMAGCFSPWATDNVRVVQVGGVSAWCLSRGSLHLRRYDGVSTTFVLIVEESTKIRVSSKRAFDKCPRLTASSVSDLVVPRRVGFNERLACDYEVVAPAGSEGLRAQLEIPNDEFDELSIPGSSLNLLSPRPGDPVLTVTRNAG